MKIVAFAPVVFLSSVAIAQECPTKDLIRNKAFTVTFDNNNKEVVDRNTKSLKGSNGNLTWESSNCFYPLGCMTSYTKSGSSVTQSKIVNSIPTKDNYLKKPGDRIAFMAVEEQTQTEPSGVEKYLFKYWVTSTSVGYSKIKIGACEYDVLVNQSVRELIEPGDFELYRETKVLYSTLLEMPLRSEITQISNGQKTNRSQTVTAIDF